MSAWAILDHMRGRCTHRFFGSCPAGPPSPNPRTRPNGGCPHADATVSLAMAHDAIGTQRMRERLKEAAEGELVSHLFSP